MGGYGYHAADSGVVVRIERVDTKNGHYYKLDGKRAPGVTTLLNGRPKDALKYAAAREVAEYVADNLSQAPRWRAMDRGALVDTLKRVPFDRWKRAAAKGSELHVFAEHLISGDPIIVPGRIRGYVESCARFLDDWKVYGAATEVVMASFTHHYCGTADVIHDGTLYDYKSGAKGVFPETALQLTGYEYSEMYITAEGLEVLVSALGIRQCRAVWLREDGYDVFPVFTSPATFQEFLAVAAVYRGMRREKDLIGEPIHPDGAEL